MECIEADESNLESIAQIHVRSLPDDVFANLGERYLISFYRKALTNEDQSLLIVRDNDQTAGFCLVSFRRQSLLKSASVAFYVQALRLFLTKPRVFFSGVLQFLQLGKVDLGKSAEIDFFAVDPIFQSKGLGTSMLEFATVKAKGKGMKYIHTKTSNLRLARFYKNRLNAREKYGLEIFGVNYSVLQWEIF